MIVALVGCGLRKATRPCRAADLYLGSHYRMQRRWAERRADSWYILSALHGLLAPDRVIAPYEATLPEGADLWLARVRAQVLEATRPGDVLVGLAPARYLAFLPVEGRESRLPLAGRDMRIGKRNAWLKREA